MCSTATAWSMEAENIDVLRTFGGAGATNITFRQTYATPPVVVATATSQGGDSSDIYITNVTTSGFTITSVEPNNNDGPHVEMNLAYIAMELGAHQFPDGTLIEAGIHSTTSVQHGAGVTGATAFDTVSFSSAFTAQPAIVAALQTHNNEISNPPNTSAIPFISPAVLQNGAASVRLAIERSESGAGAVTVPEQIGYIAIENNSTGQFLDSANNTIEYEGFIGPTLIRGWTDGCFTQNFNNNYGFAPRVVATKITRNESDGGWLRRCSLNANVAGYRVDEDRDNDPERTHVGELGALLVFENDFDARFVPDLLILKSALTFTDPFSAVNPKAIPGAVVDYTIAITNQGIGTVDAGTFSLTDAIPVTGALVINDIAGAGSGPLILIDGAPPSTLNYTFTGLASGTDDIQFSNDNAATFNYTPVADTNGVDTAVTHIRVTPMGTFTGRTGPAAPSVQLRFRVMVE